MSFGTKSSACKDNKFQSASSERGIRTSLDLAPTVPWKLREGFSKTWIILRGVIWGLSQSGTTD